MLAESASAAPAPARSGRYLGTLLLLGPPVVWISRIAASYILVPAACADSGPLFIHLATGIAVLLIGGMTGLAAHRWYRLRDRSAETTDQGASRQRDRFLSGAGLLSSAFFLGVVVAEGAMPLLIHPCV